MNLQKMTNKELENLISTCEEELERRKYSWKQIKEEREIYKLEDTEVPNRRRTRVRFSDSY